MSVANLPEPSRLWRHMQDTHDISLLVSEEADIINAVNEDHDRTVESLLQQREALEAELDAWREVAGQLATAAEHAGRPHHPSAWHTDQRTSALESYARLKSGFNSYEL